MSQISNVYEKGFSITQFCYFVAANVWAQEVDSGGTVSNQSARIVLVEEIVFSKIIVRLENNTVFFTKPHTVFWRRTLIPVDERLSGNSNLLWR